jgi:nucleoid DNA-binding protein
MSRKRTTYRYDQTILKLAAAELVRRAVHEIVHSLRSGPVKLRGFGGGDAAHRRHSRAPAAGRQRPRGRGQRG